MTQSEQINKINFTTKMLYPSLTFGEHGPMRFAKEIAAKKPDVLFLNLRCIPCQNMPIHA